MNTSQLVGVISPVLTSADPASPPPPPPRFLASASTISGLTFCRNDSFCDARNAVLDATESDFVFWLDADDHIILFLSEKSRIREIEKLFQVGVTFL